MNRSSVWVVASEARLLSRFERLPEQRKQIQTLADQLEQQVAANLAVWTQLEKAQAALAKARGSERDRLKQRVAQLKRQCVSPDRLGGQPAVRENLVRWTNLRAEIYLTTMAIREQAPGLADRYEPLARRADVAGALAELGAGHRLGPSREPPELIQSLGEFEQLVFTQDVPLLQDAGYLRFGAILNRRRPVTFTWSDSSQPTVVAHSALVGAGLIVPDDAPREVYDADSGRQLQVARVTIPYVRVGKHVLRNVAALALPPEGEDLGCRIGGDAFGSLRAEPQPARLRLAIREIDP